MPLNILKQDLRSRKTKKALNDAMFVLLEKHNFRKLTIKDICSEAAISRATFYAHFLDKYDLLKYWLINMEWVDLNKDDAYEVWEMSVNQFAAKNKKIIKNVMDDADNETLRMVFETFLCLLSLDDDKSGSPKYIVSSNILAGGLVHYLSWHAQHNFPSDIMNIHIYELITNFYEWILE